MASLDEMPVVGMDRGLETLQVEDVVRRVPEDCSSPWRRPEDAGAVVQRPEPRLGRVGRETQARFAVPQRFVGRLACQRVREHLRDQLQALHELLRPVARRPQGIERQRANVLPDSHRERKTQARLDAMSAPMLGVDGGLRRQLIRRRDGNRAAGEHLLEVPGAQLLPQRVGTGRPLYRPVHVGGRGDAWFCRRPLPQHREVDAQKLADWRSSVLDRAVDVAGRQLDEPARKGRRATSRTAQFRRILEDGRYRRESSGHYLHASAARPAWADLPGRLPEADGLVALPTPAKGLSVFLRRVGIRPRVNRGPAAVRAGWGGRHHRRARVPC